MFTLKFLLYLCSYLHLFYAHTRKASASAREANESNINRFRPPYLSSSKLFIFPVLYIIFEILRYSSIVFKKFLADEYQIT